MGGEDMVDAKVFGSGDVKDASRTPYRRSQMWRISSAGVEGDVAASRICEVLRAKRAMLRPGAVRGEGMETARRERERGESEVARRREEPFTAMRVSIW